MPVQCQQGDFEHHQAEDEATARDDGVHRQRLGDAAVVEDLFQRFPRAPLLVLGERAMFHAVSDVDRQALKCLKCRRKALAND